MTEQATPQGLTLTLEEAQKLLNLFWKMPTEFGLPGIQILQGAQQRAQGVQSFTPATPVDPAHPPSYSPGAKKNGKAAQA